MDIVQIRKLVEKGESESLEFKRSTGQLDKAMKTVCAFLNGFGGTVLIGIRENGEIIGQQVSDGTIHDIVAHINEFEPPPPLEYRRIPILEKDLEVIAIIATPSQETRPYSYRGRPYERTGSQTRFMSQESYQELLLERIHAVRRWENNIADTISIEDLDRDTILRIVRMGKENRRIPESIGNDPLDFLSRFKLIKDQKPVNAAMVLFGKDFLSDYPQCLLKMARFKGTDKNEFIDNKQERGNIFTLLEKADAFLTQYIPIAGKVIPGQLQRKDEPLYSTRALREALLNAFCHRDYSFQGGSVDIALYEDRLEIWSTGGLPFGLTIDDLKGKHLSRPRNPLIAEVLFRGGYIEMWGRGTNNIIDDCINAGLLEPEFIEERNSVGIRFRSDVHEQTEAIESNLTARQKEIVLILSVVNEASLAYIINKMENPPAIRTLSNDLSILKDLNIVTLKGFGRGSKWILKNKDAIKKQK
jgi:ATP-dependent DNA helicase RecG